VPRQHKPTIAITGLEGRDNPYPGIAVARALRAAMGAKIRLIGLAYDPMLTGALRRDLFDAVYVTPLPSDPPAVLLHRLREIHAQDPITGFIPTLDSEIPLWSRLQDEFAREGWRTMLPPHAAVLARTKVALAGFCGAHGFHTPRTEPVSHVDSFFARSDWSFPVFLKGPIADAERVTNLDEARNAYARLSATWGFPVLAQEPLVGTEFDVAAVADRGQLDSAVAIRKVALSSLGKAVAAEVVEDRAALELAARIVRALNWHGPLELELMKSARDGVFHLIEINGRFPAWVGMTPEAGLNLPARVLERLLDTPVSRAGQARTGTLFFRTSRTTIGSVDDLSALQNKGSLS
jgi:carbamoyl-phosphate synthase large subunit